MPKIKGNEIVEKRNILNEIRKTNMTLQQLRFFSIYLSKINARDLSTRIVRFPLADFQKIMGLGKMNIQNFRNTVDSLLRNVVHIPTPKGGLVSFTLFQRCLLDKDECGNWYVEINANDNALPLMFDFKSHYFTYQLWNALQLKSATQIRMYELLKQYEYIGKREIAVSELRELLGIAPNEYPRFSNFKMRILDSCQQALTENTDICFTYERGKVGERGKWLTIVFHIRKNENYVDRLSLKDFINLQPEPQAIEEIAAESTQGEKNHNISQEDNNVVTDEAIELPVKGTIYEIFTTEQIDLLCNILLLKVPASLHSHEQLEKKLIGIYSEIQLRYPKVKDPLAMILKFINNMPDYDEIALKNKTTDEEDKRFAEDYEIFLNRF